MKTHKRSEKKLIESRWQRNQDDKNEYTRGIRSSAAIHPE